MLATPSLKPLVGALSALTLSLILAAGALPISAQEPPEAAPLTEEPSVEDFSKPMGPPDPLNRGTPRGSMHGFIVACRAGDYERATEFMDLRRLSPQQRERAQEIAQRLKAVLDQKLWIDFTTLSDQNQGFASDGLPAWQDHLGVIETPEETVPILPQRVPREGDQVRIWKVAASTVARADELYD
jgi:MscS family membrane protein